MGGTTISGSKSENILNTKQASIAKEETKEAESDKNITETAGNQKDDISQNLTCLLTQQKLAHSHLEYQNTAIALQQQESQLLATLQLKKYEENLYEMQQKQQELLIKQERQFNTLLERQFAKQQIMENNMRLQQERINNHIQMLISQPHVPLSENCEAQKTLEEENKNASANVIEVLKQRQHEEIFLLEESYKYVIIISNPLDCAMLISWV